MSQDSHSDGTEMLCVVIAFLIAGVLLWVFISLKAAKSYEAESSIEYELDTNSEFEESFVFDRFAYIGEEDITSNYGIVSSSVVYWVDIETKVIYFQLGDRLTLSPLLNSDGKPILWEGKITK